MSDEKVLDFEGEDPEAREYKKAIVEVLLTAGRPLTENEIHERVERLMAERQTPS